MVPGGEELAPGLVRGEALHPSWKQVVACVALTGDDALVLVDPLAPPGVREARRFWRALDGSVAEAGGQAQVVLTLHYHRRSGPEAAARYDAPLWVPAGSERRLRSVRVDRVFAAGDLRMVVPLHGPPVATDAVVALDAALAEAAAS